MSLRACSRCLGGTRCKPRYTASSGMAWPLTVAATASAAGGGGSGSSLTTGGGAGGGGSWATATPRHINNDKATKIGNLENTVNLRVSANWTAMGSPSHVVCIQRWVNEFFRRNSFSGNHLSGFVYANTQTH